MINLFISVLNMSLTGAFVITAICFARLVLRNNPKIFLLCLWAAAGFRLVFPFSIESTFSLMPFSAQMIPADIVSYDLSAATLANGGSRLQIWLIIGACIWLAGVLFMLFRGVASLVTLKRNLKEAVNVEANIYETETLKTPFVSGVFSPKIYLPAHLSDQEREYVILHEQAHIRRYDHIVKFAAYFILCLHWFNPLAWLAFLLMNVDMEMSCDERVLKGLGGGAEIKKNYSSALLSLATDRCIIGRSSLAFNDGDVSSRVKNILNLKKQPYIAFVMSMMLVAALSVGFSVNRVTANYHIDQENTHIIFSCCD